ncbi:hypothetical protein CSP17_004369, partial [Salmonella enterica subsp. arizonae]|nr:hypothetical protein [Salmonella enterica subsp. arizonae]EDV3680615.1 hypothetical protein [Salmonella enterica subsp. arizonae]
PLILKRTVLRTVLNHLARTYQNMVLVYWRRFMGIPQRFGGVLFINPAKPCIEVG